VLPGIETARWSSDRRAVSTFLVLHVMAGDPILGFY
jgi:hypothetical protein